MKQHGNVLRLTRDEEVPLGECCICQGAVAVRNIILLPSKCPTPGQGWDCEVCGLPPDGALAVLCECCYPQYLAGCTGLRYVCTGQPALDGRTPYRCVTGLHLHNRAICGEGL